MTDASTVTDQAARLFERQLQEWLSRHPAGDHVEVTPDELTLLIGTDGETPVFRCLDGQAITQAVLGLAAMAGTTNLVAVAAGFLIVCLQLMEVKDRARTVEGPAALVVAHLVEHGASSPERIATASGLDPATVLRACEELWKARILTSEDGVYDLKELVLNIGRYRTPS